ncbi:RlmE family RNA methyltransferase [Falsiroseomonas stagni]|uniref:Ribosomal RNA large subunit methyltransferase E n=1 Tax=Falsiroseomonas stagni DSM 19981 TaxID=1123062 RepID=A0A1I4BAS0_9PROT|nr:RlmE family RNA methyltransferase [Falsiroseomonas stagni]SFK65237.1 23S rRNA (uridine2552-2'-O)-methyltransferase [Falsiroseomonas stagni DSM 19981]
MAKTPGGKPPSTSVPGRQQTKGGARPADRALKTRLRTAEGRTIGSQKWLERQLNDPYVKEAKARGLRSRAAFKLEQMDDKFHLLKPGSRVVDLGAAPGGWTQVSLARAGATAKVVAIDLLPVDPIPGAILIQGDFQEAAAEQAVLAALDGQADLVLSDMAPNTTGHNATDHLRIMALAELALDFAGRVLAPGGGFVTKVLAGGSEKEFLATLKRDFAVVRHAKPPASRKDSAELYVVATGFRGGKA